MISLFKILIFKYTKKEYEFYHFFYANMMPEEIVSGEKIIRSQLSEINFLWVNDRLIGICNHT